MTESQVQEAMEVDADEVHNAEPMLDQQMTDNIKHKTMNILSTPCNKSTSSLIKRPRSSLRRPNNSVQRLSLNALSPINQHQLQSATNHSSASSNKSNISNSTIKSRIKRPRLSISRPSRTGPKINRLSLSSISHNLMNEDLLNVKDDYFESMSTKSMESQHTVNSKISFISSQSSNRSSFFNHNHTQNRVKNEQEDKDIKQKKLENARIHLEIEKLKGEKKYYQDLVKSIQHIVIQHNDDHLTDKLNQIFI